MESETRTGTYPICQQYGTIQVQHHEVPSDKPYWVMRTSEYTCEHCHRTICLEQNVVKADYYQAGSEAET